jgi:hypothetical protein
VGPVQAWLYDHPLITYILIFILIAFVYNKVFRVKKLPVIKEIIVYLLMAVGALFMWLFQLDIGLPIVQCLLIAVSLMLIVRIRYWVTDREKRKAERRGQAAGEPADKPAGE